MISEYFKDRAREVVGEKNLHYIKGVIEIIKNKKYYRPGYYRLNTDFVNSISEFGEEGFDTFCGYYDYFPLSKNKKYLLCQRVRHGASAAKDITEIGYYPIDGGKFVHLANSMAWSWQQGSRAHWSDVGDDIIFYNDMEGNEYCTKIFDVRRREIKTILKPALYDINNAETKGASVNFARLQRLRPGYGYSKLKDKTIGENAPKDDGLLVVDINTGESKLVVSLDLLASDVDPHKVHQHYINHVSFSPKGTNIMFFHIWTDDKWPGWMTRLCLYNLSEDKVYILESNKLVSHYCWMGENRLLITGADKNTRKAFYCLYDKAGNKLMLNEQLLSKDGHPTIDPSKTFFITDTYPDNQFIQKVYMYIIDSDRRIDLLDVFSDPRLVREYRCDLHPKFMDNYIVVDSTLRNCSRSVLLLELNYKRRC